MLKFKKEIILPKLENRSLSNKEASTKKYYKINYNKKNNKNKISKENSTNTRINKSNDIKNQVFEKLKDLIRLKINEGQQTTGQSNLSNKVIRNSINDLNEFYESDYHEEDSSFEFISTFIKSRAENALKNVNFIKKSTYDEENKNIFKNSNSEKVLLINSNLLGKKNDKNIINLKKNKYNFFLHDNNKNKIKFSDKKIDNINNNSNSHLFLKLKPQIKIKINKNDFFKSFARFSKGFTIKKINIKDNTKNNFVKELNLNDFNQNFNESFKIKNKHLGLNKHILNKKLFVENKTIGQQVNLNNSVDLNEENTFYVNKPKLRNSLRNFIYDNNDRIKETPINNQNSNQNITYLLNKEKIRSKKKMFSSMKSFIQSYFSS